MRRTYRRRSEVAAPPIDERIGQRQRLARVAAALGDMDDRLRDVLVMSELDEASSREIACALAIPVGTVKSRLRRAREELIAAAGAGAT